jgi:hypothetical protein
MRQLGYLPAVRLSPTRENGPKIDDEPAKIDGMKHMRLEMEPKPVMATILLHPMIRVDV